MGCSSRPLQAPEAEGLAVQGRLQHLALEISRVGCRNSPRLVEKGSTPGWCTDDFQYPGTQNRVVTPQELGLGLPEGRDLLGRAGVGCGTVVGQGD